MLLNLKLKFEFTGIPALCMYEKTIYISTKNIHVMTACTQNLEIVAINVTQETMEEAFKEISEH